MTNAEIFPAWRQMPSIKPTTKYKALRHKQKFPKKNKVDGTKMQIPQKTDDK